MEKKNTRKRYIPRSILKYQEGQSTYRQVSFSDSERSAHLSDYSGETSDTSYEGMAYQNRDRGTRKTYRKPQDQPQYTNQRSNPPPQPSKNGGREGVESIGARRYLIRAHFYKQNTVRVNYASFIISDSQRCKLSKGFGFSPSNQFNPFETIKTINKCVRLLTLKKYFSEQDIATASNQDATIEEERIHSYNCN